MALTQINKAGLDELALDHVFTIGASGTDHYTFQGEGLNGTVNDPTLYLTRGKTYRFENGTGSHPIRIQSTSGASGTAYNTGVTNNAGSGTVIVEVQHDAPDVLYYQCTSHANMNGILYITGALADGGVTTAKIADSAVTTAKIAADAVTGAKIADDAINSEHYTDGSIDTAHIANSQVTADKLADNAVTTNKIQNSAVSTAKINDGAVTDAKIADTAVTLAKLEHGTSSNDGKFLRANNGADPTFETVSGTTINNNADNRVITGSGTANTLEAESGLTYNGSNSLAISGSGQQQLTIGSTDAGGAVITLDGDSNGDGAGGDYSFIRHNTDGDLEFFARNPSGATNTIFKQGTSEQMRVDSSGKVFIGDTSNLDSNKVNIFGTKAYSSGIPQQQLAVADAQAYSVTDNGGSIGFLARFNSSGSYTTMGSIEGVKHNNIDGNYQGAIAFKTRNHNGDNVIRMRLTDNGLCFGTDTAGANALDDYEEGTWTPSAPVSSNHANLGTFRYARYVKIGQVVHLWCDCYQSSNNMEIQAGWELHGFPFTVNSNGFLGPANVGTFSYTSSQSSYIPNYIDNGSGGYLYIHTHDWSPLRHMWFYICYNTTQ